MMLLVIVLPTLIIMIINHMTLALVSTGYRYVAYSVVFTLVYSKGN